jgi:DNA-binding HxlR family transcriptional regulator
MLTTEDTRQMSRLEKRSMKSCQVGMDLAAIGKKWTFHILRNIGALHVDRFNQILRSVPGLTPRVLMMRLNELEERGLIRSVIIKQRPRLVRWELTEKGRDTVPIVEGYLSFAQKWYPNSSLKNHLAQQKKQPGLLDLIELATKERSGDALKTI